MSIKISKLKGYWVVVDKSNNPHFTTVSKESEQDSINKFCGRSTSDWGYFSGIGYKCIQVTISFKTKKEDKKLSSVIPLLNNQNISVSSKREILKLFYGATSNQASKIFPDESKL